MTIGVDPDVEKSGVAILKDGELSLRNLTFFELFDFLKLYDMMQIDMVYIEAGWLNEKSNFRPSSKAGVNARIGKNVGSNHEIGRKLVEMCQYLSIPFTEVRPLKKVWKGCDGKITHEEFNKIAKTNFRKTNQEVRDAGLILITR